MVYFQIDCRLLFVLCPAFSIQYHTGTDTNQVKNVINIVFIVVASILSESFKLF